MDNLEAVKAEIQAVNDEFDKVCLETKDPVKMAEYYTEDCRLMSPHQPLVIGRKGVEETIAGFLASGIASLNMEVQEVLFADGDLALERGKYTLHNAAGVVLDEGKSMTAWKKVDGSYKLHWNIFNSSKPSPQPTKK